MRVEGLQKRRYEIASEGSKERTLPNVGYQDSERSDVRANKCQ